MIPKVNLAVPKQILDSGLFALTRQNKKSNVSTY